MTSGLQQQARALGDPTRHRIFRHVADADGPVGVAELTELLGLNHNAIRQHLAKLVAAELVVEERSAPAGPGRPRLVYRLHPRAADRWVSAGPYERLSAMLAEVIASGRSPEEVGRDAGRANAVSAGDLDQIAEQLHETIARSGFDPDVRTRPDRIDVVLRACPFEATAVSSPETVCALHLGIAEGLVADVDGVEVAELVAKDPRRANCRLRFTVDGPAPDVQPTSSS